jgi:hypothetical protein
MQQQSYFYRPPPSAAMRKPKPASASHISWVKAFPRTMRKLFIGFGVPLNWVTQTAKPSLGPLTTKAAPCQKIQPQPPAGIGAQQSRATSLRSDFSESARWYRLAAEQSDPVAQIGLAASYFRGDGLPQDYAAAAM